MTEIRRSDHSWEEEGAHRVAPDVYRIPLPLPGDALRAVNVYLVVGDKRATMIDGGQQIVAARKVLEKSLASVGVGIGDISEFLVTHIHRDHYTQASAIREEYGTKVNLGELELPSFRVIQSDAFASHQRQENELIKAGAKELLEKLGDEGPLDEEMRTWYRDPDRWLTDLEVVDAGNRRLKVLSTPGHTRGHVVYYDEAANVVFAGDHVLPHITPSIGLESARPEFPLRDYLASLKRVRMLPDAKVLPAHGPVVDSLHHRVDELVAHHDNRLSEAAQAVAHGHHTAYEVANYLRWTSRGRQFSELDPFNQVMAVMESKYHLDLLCLQGVLRSGLEGEIEVYALVASPADPS